MANFLFVEGHMLDLTVDPFDDLFRIQVDYAEAKESEDRRHFDTLAELARCYEERMYAYELDREIRNRVLSGLRMIYAPQFSRYHDLAKTLHTLFARL